MYTLHPTSPSTLCTAAAFCIHVHVTLPSGRADAFPPPKMVESIPSAAAAAALASSLEELSSGALLLLPPPAYCCRGDGCFCCIATAAGRAWNGIGSTVYNLVGHTNKAKSNCCATTVKTWVQRERVPATKFRGSAAVPRSKDAKPAPGRP